MKKIAILDISKVEDLERSLKTAHQHLNIGNIKEGHRHVLNALEIIVCESSNTLLQESGAMGHSLLSEPKQ